MNAIACCLLTTAAIVFAADYRNPVIPGDHPDPSVIRVGNDYWATSTTSEWAPIFPLLHSRDLVNWTTVGAIFETPPAWSAGSYWAPEISEFKGTFAVYYAARNRARVLCVAVATASNVKGPYTDRGPLVCQEDGSIDPAPTADENGKRYLLWKEDGNSRHRPSPIWAQPLSDDGTRLIGSPSELIRNDAPWEGQLVEGPFVLRRHGYFYLFYAAAGCCGVHCDYKVGVARSRHLLGPWIKYSKNPLAVGNANWNCPGHGSIVSDPSGRDYLLYHAYRAQTSIFLGREAVLDRVSWTEDDWPKLDSGSDPSVQAPAPFPATVQSSRATLDSFDSSALSPLWQWPWNNKPRTQAGGGWLTLGSADASGAILAQSPVRPDYTVEVGVDPRSLKAASSGGLAAYGNRENAIGIAIRNGAVYVWRRQKGAMHESSEIPCPNANVVYLRMTVHEGREFQFAFSTDRHQWRNVKEEVASKELPPWDLGLRVALTAGGTPDTAARFTKFRIEPLP
jgi:xylan 1,4-beta-xylosidase